MQFKIQHEAKAPLTWTLSRAEETRKMPRVLLEEDSQPVYATCVQSRESRLNNELRKRGAGAPGLTKSEKMRCCRR